jgi:hypothetical protein
MARSARALGVVLDYPRSVAKQGPSGQLSVSVRLWSLKNLVTSIWASHSNQHLIFGCQISTNVTLAFTSELTTHNDID